MMPNTQRVIEIKDHALIAAVRAIPIPADDQVLVKVTAAGVNRPDVMQRKGLYPPPPGASDIPGLEVAGTVAAVGASVHTVRVGEPVCALVTGGGYAQYCLASAPLCLPIPRGWSLLEAAGLPETLFTVWSNVFDRAGLKANETLLVHGGSGGIGTAAIQLAKAFGAKVLVTAGSEEKCRFCCDLGADAAINYQQQDFVEAVKQLTAGLGVDVILDSVGGDYLPRNIQCLGVDGRLLQIAVQNGVKAEINLLAIMLKRLTLTGSTLRARDDDFKAAIAHNLRQRVWPLLENRTVKPVIHAVFALNDAARAHALMESGWHTGKIMLQI
jgi:NADPH2:quinone reductase